MTNKFPFLSINSEKYCIFASKLAFYDMNNIDWKKALVFLIVIGGLVYITKAELGMTTTNSFLTTLGILLLLFIGDNFAQKIDDERKRRKLENENEN